jgi:hypothetical protein
MSGAALKILKAGGIAVLYAVAVLLFCVTAMEIAEEFLWEPFQAHFENDKNPDAWPTFLGCYIVLVQVMTAAIGPATQVAFA